jgi:hypothetical protein
MIIRLKNPRKSFVTNLLSVLHRMTLVLRLPDIYCARTRLSDIKCCVVEGFSFDFKLFF